MPQYAIEGEALITVNASRTVIVEADSQQEALQKAEAELRDTTGQWFVPDRPVSAVAGHSTVHTLQVLGFNESPEIASSVYRSVFSVTLDPAGSTPDAAPDDATRMIQDRFGRTDAEAPDDVYGWEFLVDNGVLQSPSPIQPDGTRCSALLVVFMQASSADEARESAWRALHAAAQHDGRPLFKDILGCQPTRRASPDELEMLRPPRRAAGRACEGKDAPVYIEGHAMSDVRDASSSAPESTGRKPWESWPDRDRIRLAYHVQGDVLWVDMLELPPERRHGGAGRLLWQHFEESLPSHLQTIRLMAADTGSGASEGFWERMGFEVESRSNKHGTIMSKPNPKAAPAQDAAEPRRRPRM